MGESRARYTARPKYGNRKAEFGGETEAAPIPLPANLAGGQLYVRQAEIEQIGGDE